jgi:DNA replication protein DnaC
MTSELKSVTENLVRGHIPVPGKVVKPIPPSLCVPDCPICGGIGWIRQDLPLDHPDFGKLKPCPNLNAYKVYGSQLGLTEKDLELSWSDLALKDQETRTAHLAIINALKRGYGWVFLHGNYGSAKSLMLKIAVSEAIRSGKIGVYVRMASFVDHLRSAFDEQNPNAELVSRLEWWSTLPVLALDEVEKVSLTGFAKEKMFLLFDQRYEDATLNKKGVTIMASNLPPAGLDPYLTDRIRDGRFAVIEMTGSSMRPMMRYGGQDDARNE